MKLAARAWWHRRTRGERVPAVAGLVVLLAIVDPAVRRALLTMVAAGIVLAVLGLVVAGTLMVLTSRALRRHPLLDLAAGYWLGRRHERRQEPNRALPSGQAGFETYEVARPMGGPPPPSWDWPPPPAPEAFSGA